MRIHATHQSNYKSNHTRFSHYLLIIHQYCKIARNTCTINHTTFQRVNFFNRNRMNIMIYVGTYGILVHMVYWYTSILKKQTIIITFAFYMEKLDQGYPTHTAKMYVHTHTHTHMHTHTRTSFSTSR